MKSKCKENTYKLISLNSVVNNPDEEAIFAAQYRC